MIKRLLHYAILFVLVTIIINLFCCIFLSIKENRIALNEDSRASLPTYKDKNYSKLIFKELNSLKTDYYSYVGWKRSEFKGLTVNINNNGIRYNPKQKLNIKDGIKNVYFLGGSTMWGTGVDDNNTIPAIWHQLNNNVNVYNYGESAYDSRQSLESIINIIALNKKIDIVVFYVGVNEINRCRNIIGINSHIYEKKFRDKINEEFSYFETLTYKYINIVINKIFNRLTNIDENSVYELQCDCDEKRIENVVETMYINLLIAKQLTEKKGGKFIAILQPVIYVGNPNKSYLSNYLESKTESINLNYQKLYKKIIDNNSKDFELYDFSNAFNKTDNIYIDECHVNELGNKIIALKIDSLITKLKY